MTRSPERFGAKLSYLGAEVVVADPADYHDTHKAWHHVDEAITAMRTGTLHGKAVADIE